MFNMIKGTVIEAQDNELTVDVGGIGFAVCVVQPMHFAQGAMVQLYTYLHWNQEQGPCMYGFSSITEKKLFLMIISCSGIGPKIALALLNQLAPGTFIKAIANNDVATLSSVNGIGPKKAEHMLVQLRHKITPLLEAGLDTKDLGDAGRWKDVSDALSSLNYSRQEVAKSMHYLQEQFAGKQASFDELLRHSLSYLSKKI